MAKPPITLLKIPILRTKSGFFMTKNKTDAGRFSRYQSVVDVLLRKGSFHKADIYDALKDEEKAFIGRVISELVRDNKTGGIGL